jgi:hypothetical protein
MAAAEKTVSSLIETQLPDFVNANHPQFRRFIELYYQWLEQNSADGISNTAGNTVYHAMGIENYRDIDQTPDEFVTYFKEELLPYFPENPSLDIIKLLKSAREYYSKKGSEESLRWLFKALYDTDIEVNYPKEQILIVSDGKWKKPRAFRITVGESNKDVDVNLLEKKLVVGSESGATCIVESANRSIDETNGREIIEIYISNITKYFNNGEDILINYIDANGVSKVFREKIIGTLSNIRVDSNIRTDPSQRRRGLLYNVGDPVVITGGLGVSAEANDAAALVGNVTRGSIEAVTPTFIGYGYREYHNTQIVVLRTIGVDDDEANSSTDLRVLALNTTACTSNSQRNFLETMTYDKTVIDYSNTVVISSANFAAMTPKNINVVLNVTEEDYLDYFDNFETIYADTGTNIFDSTFVGKIGTPNGNTKITGTVSFYGDTSASGTVEVYGNTAVSGAVSVNTALGSKTVTGTSTSFLTEFSSGDFIRIKIDDYSLSTHEIDSVDSDTQLTLTTDFPVTVTSQPAYKANLTVTGTSTAFLSEINSGNTISVNGVTRIVDTISSDTVLTVTVPFNFSSSGNNIYLDVESGSTTVIGNNTKFTQELKTSQTLRIDGEDQTISTIVDDTHLTVGSAYATTLVNEDAYRIGTFADQVGPDATADLLIYDAEYSGSLSSLIGETLVAANSGKTWVVNSVTASSVDANASSMMIQTFDYESVNTGGLAAITVIEGGFGFRAEPSLDITSYYDTDLSEDYSYTTQKALKEETWQRFKDLGVIAHVYINNGGTNYSVGDGLVFVGRGYSANGHVQSVNVSSGAITSVILDNRGEGYLLRPEVFVNRGSLTYTTLTGTATVNNESAVVTGTGTVFLTALNTRNVIKINNEIRRVVSITNATSLIVNSAFTANATLQTIYRQDGEEASLTAYLFGDGFTGTVDTSAIGRVQDIRLLYRGYDYVNTPIVSLKVVDTVIDPIPEDQTLIEQEYVYQGTSLQTSSFRANVKSYNRSTNLLRLYNYSGSIDTTRDITSANGVTFTVDTSERVPVPVRGILIGTGPSTSYPPSVADLPNPMYYGNGRARANAQFANGLIEFNGFFLNTDGFPSSDKVLQDKELYHNFSYVIQAEKDLIEYESTLKNIGHPAGMELSAKRIVKSEANDAVTIDSNSDVFLSTYDSSRVTVQDSRSNVVTGYGTDFTNSIGANTTANVGDLFVISYSGAWSNTKILSDTSLRTQVKEITKINSNTELEIKGDFVIAGQGRVNSNVLFSSITGTVNTDPAVSGTVNVNSPLVGTVNVNESITGTLNVVTSNVIIGNGTLFLTEVLANDIISVNNQVKQIVSITNNQHLYVNSAFTYVGTDNIGYLSNVVVIGSGTYFEGNVYPGDILTINGETRSVVSVDSNTKLNVNVAFINTANTQLVYPRSNIIIGVGTNFDPQVNVGDVISVNNEFKKVTLRTNDEHLIVNSAFTNYATGQLLYKQNAVLLGIGTTFTSQLAANDVIKVNNEIREVISIEDNTHLTVNTPFEYTGTLNTITKLSNTTLTVSGNTNALSDIIVTGDTITFNIANANVYKAQTGTVEIFSTNGKVVGTSTSFNTELIVGDYIKVNNEIRQIVNISSSSVLNVNSAFSDDATGNILYKRATVVNANVVSVSSNNITIDTAIEANTRGLVWLTVPNYFLAKTLSGTVNVTGGGIYITGNTTSPNVTYFVGNVAVGMDITVNNEIRQIVAISNNANLTVNLAFNVSATDKYLTTTNSYDYKIITLTKDVG